VSDHIAAIPMTLSYRQGHLLIVYLCIFHTAVQQLKRFQLA